MRYVLLIQIDEKGMEGKSPEEMAPVLDAWHKYTDDLQKSGSCWPEKRFSRPPPPPPSECSGIRPSPPTAPMRR